MLSLTASSPVPFGVRRRMHPALRFGAATLGSVALIAAGSMFLTQAVTQAAADAPLPRTEREVWYVPSSPPAVPAAELDIARSVPVNVAIPAAAAPPVASAFTHKVGVESLRVRSGPVKTSTQVFALKGGTPVLLGQTSNGWVRITTQDGRSGWVFAKLLNPA